MSVLGVGAIAYLAGEATSPIGRGIDAYLGPMWDSTRRTSTYRWNKQTPNVIPSAELAMRVRWAAECNEEQLETILNFHGISFNNILGENTIQNWWDRVNTISRPRIPVDVAMRAQALGRQIPIDANTLLRYSGITYQAERDVILKDSPPIGIGELLELYWRDVITRRELIKYLNHAGYRDDEIQRLVTAKANPIPWPTAIDLFNRGIITREELQTYVQWAGLVGEKEYDAIIRLGETQLSMQQMLDLRSLNVFDDNYAAAMGLDLERDDIFNAFSKQMGYQYVNKEAAAAAPALARHNMSDYLWRGRWQRISIGVASELLHRLRPTGGVNGGPRVQGAVPFTRDDYNNVLSSNNVAPGMRDRLSAISYAIPQRLLVKRLYAAGIIDRAEVKEVIQDQGYNVDNAERLTQLIEHEEIQANVNRLRPLTVGQIKDGYAVGSLSRNDAARYLQMVYDSDYVTVSTFMGYSQDRQLGIAQANPWVTLALNAIDTDVNSKLLAKAIEVVRKTYLRAEIDAIHARDQLVSMGIVFDRAQTYVQLWSYELAAEGAETTASQLIDFYVQGLIDELTVTSRLIRLHYSPTDIALLLARANIKISQRQAKILAAQQNATKKQAESLAKTQRQLAAQMQSNAKALCKSSSKAQLVKWAVKGLINYADAYKRLTQCGMASLDAVSALAIGAGLSGANANEQIIKKIGDAFQGATDTATHPAAKPASPTGSTTGH